MLTVERGTNIGLVKFGSEALLTPTLNCRKPFGPSGKGKAHWNGICGSFLNWLINFTPYYLIHY
ncbi:hypothetical protein bcere0007_57450 [Bacillus mycoides]|nr:hypothetical protein bcere0007_57450 [Bacillus mycoides]